MENRFHDHDEDERMPYWMWVCDRYGPQDADNRSIGLSELFVLMLDRLEQDGVNMEGIINGISRLTLEFSVYETVQAEAYSHFAQFAAGLRLRSSESHYARLRERSRHWLDILERCNEWMTINQIDTDAFAQALARLQDAVAAAISSFKERLISKHTLYFHNDSQLQPIHLGCQLFALHIMETTRRYLSFQPPSMTNRIQLSQSSLCTLMDWYGDYEEYEAMFWHRELKKIMGI